WSPQPGARHVRLRPPQHDPGVGFLQHPAGERRSGDRGRGAQRLPAEREAAGSGDRDRGDRRADPAAVRPPWPHRRVAPAHQPRPLPGRGRAGRRHGLHAPAGGGKPGRLRVARLAAPHPHRQSPPSPLRLGRRLLLEAQPGIHLRGRLRPHERSRPGVVSDFLSLRPGSARVFFRRPGRDVTVVTYGACCRIAMEAADKLAEVGIETEVIDVQTLLPFDLHGRIGESLRRTNRVLFLDEDVPGGATAFMLQQVVESQGGFAWLDSPPRTLTAKAHRPPYGSDGDYFSKPNRESIFEAVYDLMNEADPASFPIFYR